MNSSSIRRSSIATSAFDAMILGMFSVSRTNFAPSKRFGSVLSYSRQAHVPACVAPRASVIVTKLFPLQEAEAIVAWPLLSFKREFPSSQIAVGGLGSLLRRD